MHAFLYAASRAHYPSKTRGLTGVAVMRGMEPAEVGPACYTLASGLTFPGHWQCGPGPGPSPRRALLLSRGQTRPSYYVHNASRAIGQTLNPQNLKGPGTRIQSSRTVAAEQASPSSDSGAHSGALDRLGPQVAAPQAAPADIYSGHWEHWLAEGLQARAGFSDLESSSATARPPFSFVWTRRRGPSRRVTEPRTPGPGPGPPPAHNRQAAERPRRCPAS